MIDFEEMLEDYLEDIDFCYNGIDYHDNIATVSLDEIDGVDGIKVKFIWDDDENVVITVFHPNENITSEVISTEDDDFAEDINEAIYSFIEKSDLFE